MREPTDCEWPRQPAMLIDDDLVWLQVLQRALHKLGWMDVRILSEAAHAVPLACEFKPAVILLDLRLRTHSGHDVLRNLRAQVPATPVIMVTCVDQIEEAVACMQEGACDYLVKPPRQDRLLATLRRAVAEPATVPGAGADHFAQSFAQLRELPRLKDMPDLLISEALRRSNGVLRKAAGILGVTPQAICNRRRRSMPEEDPTP